MHKRLDLVNFDIANTPFCKQMLNEKICIWIPIKLDISFENCQDCIKSTQKSEKIELRSTPSLVDSDLFSVFFAKPKYVCVACI